MPHTKRTNFVVKNILAKWLSTVLLTILQLVSRRIFITYFSSSLLGLVGLLQSVISMLSLLELGVGSAIFFSLYEPLAKGDQRQINAIMQLYKRIYAYIGIAVFFFGFILLFFLDFFVKTDVSKNTVIIAYVILLSDSVISYFFSYSRNIFNADQREYFCTNCDTVSHLGAGLSQIIVTIFSGNYYLFLLVRIAWTISANIYIHIKSLSNYSYLKCRADYILPHSFKRKFYSNVKALCFANISTYLIFGTDNLLLASFVDLSSVFIFSNYSVVLSTVNKLFNNLLVSTQASIGNYMVTEGKERTYDLFKKMFFSNYVITSFTSICLISTLNPFISFWIGSNYTWSFIIEAVLVFNNYQRFIFYSVSIFRCAAGIFNPYIMFKYFGFVEGAINVIFSVVLIEIFKDNSIVWIFLGTTISTFIPSIVQPHALFKFYFGIEKLKSYWISYFIYLLITIFISFIVIFICNSININNYLIQIIWGLLVSIIVFSVFNYFLFYNSEEFRYLKKRVLNIIFKRFL